MKSSRSLRFSLLAACLVAAAIPSLSAVEEGFSLLFANRVDEARAAFEADPAEPLALAGQFLCARARGESPESARALAGLLDACAARPELPYLLSFLGNSEYHGWPPAERADLFRTLLQRDLPPINRQALQAELTETLDMLLDPAVEASARAAGTLLDHWTLLGPFGRFGASDLQQPFGPERSGFQAQYPGWQREAAWQAPDPIDRTGMVETDPLLGSGSGVTYAVNVIESPADGEGWLTIQSPANLRVWWDGKPLLEKSGYKMQTAQAASIRVPLRQGRQLLVVKIQRSGAGWFRALLQTAGGAPLEVRSIPFEWQDYAQAPLLPFSDPKFRSVEGGQPYSALSTLPAVALVSDSTPERIFHRLIEAAWYADRADYQPARRLLDDALSLAPEFALLHAYSADLTLRLAMARPASKVRFQQEAEIAFRRALELDPLCRSALIGLQTYYLDRDQIDPALDVLNQHVAAHPEILSKGYANLIHYAYGLLYSRKSFSAEAGQKLRLAARDFIPSYETLRHLFDDCESSRQTKAAAEVLTHALNLFPAYLPYLERAGRLDASLPDAPDSEPLLRRALEIHPYSTSYATALCSLLEKKGRAGELVELSRFFQSRFPYQAFWREKQAQAALRQGNRKEALRQYQAVFDAHPRRMEPFRALRGIQGSTEFPYLRYDVPLDQLDLSRADSWKTSRASVIYLLDVMVLDLHADGTYDQYIHQAVQILNQEGLQKWAEIVIPQGSNVELLAARTLTPDGKEWALSNLQDLSGQQSLSMYGIEPFSIVEYAYIQRTGSDDPGANYSAGGYFFGSEDDPMLLSKLAIVKPDSVQLTYDFNPDDFPVRISQTGGKTVYEWQNEGQDGLKPEPFAPPLGKRVPSIKWTTEPDWLTFVERQRFSLWGFEEDSPALQAKAVELGSGTASPQDYVKNVYEFVRDRIGDSAGGMTTADTLALQTGGRYQKLRLARHLLRLGGVQTQMALALENDTRDGYDPLPNLAFPAGVILVIPQQEGIPERILVDFSSRFAPLGSMPPSIHRMVALILDDSAPSLEPLDPNFWEIGLHRRSLQLVLKDDRGAEISGDYTYGDMYDRTIREALTNPEFQRQFADRQLSADLNGIHITRQSLEDVDNLSLPPRLVFQGTLPDIAKSEGEHALKINPILVRARASELISDPTRETAVEFQSSPMRNPLTVRLNMETYARNKAVIQLPEDVLLISPFGYYSCFYDWDGADLVVRRSLLIPPQTIEPERYEDWIRFCRQIDQSEDREIHIHLPSSL